MADMRRRVKTAAYSPAFSRQKHSHRGHGYINAAGVFPQAEDVIDGTGKVIYDTLKNTPAHRVRTKRKIYKQRSDSMEHYCIYQQLNGNTKLLADAIDEALPKENRDYFGEITPEVPESEMLFMSDFGRTGETRIKPRSSFCKGLNRKRSSSSDGGLRRRGLLFKKYSPTQRAPLTGATPLRESLCAREKCRRR